ncbi:hypothetical protein CMI48_04000 [Candidatus Pacearchaeota archaeon]|nr:hypothetical protein [Candidatus Pacearchaeota archaeon]|tara:strand:+ start:296 stop:634 length:339 start_codon:yes stop_codon:yes gene_type:complete
MVMNEFTGSNFTVNGYADARYRSTQKATTITTEHGTYNLLISLEARNTEGTWQPHPTVFRHHSQLITFCPDGRYTSRPLDKPETQRIERAAQEQGLTQGRTGNVQVIVKEKS